MAWRKRAIKIARLVTATITGLAVLTIASIQAEQFVQRHRSERLLRDLQAIELRVTPRSEVERVFGGRATKSAGCNASSCDYKVEINSWIVAKLAAIAERLHIPSRPLEQLMHLGAIPVRVRAHIQLRQGIVWGKGMSVIISTLGSRDYQGEGPGIALIGSAEAVPHFYFSFSRYRLARLLRHPDYIIDRPGGCEPCILGYVDFTPYAAPSDIRRLMEFDLSCLTRWIHPCRDQGDILPAAWAQYEQEERLSQEIEIKPTAGLLKMLGREARAIAVVRLTKMNRHTQPDCCILDQAKAQVLQVIKGANFVSQDGYITLQSRESELHLHESQQLIVLLDPDFDRDFKGGFGLDAWQVVSATPANLAALRIGIREDFESSTEAGRSLLPQ
ncbi:MAG TPA: hypothetical protein VKZ53_10885 [Candidatus Angelobacter sp.]|nr:hypothetical protein [Candidatus Angelobacter sp.]